MSAAGKHSQPYPWEQRKLGEIADVSSGTSIDSRATHGRNRVTRIETIANGEIDYKHIGWTNENIDPRYNLKINDILYSNINSIDHIGKNAIIKTLPFPLYHGMNLLRIVPRINSLFMFYSLNTIEHRIWAKSHANKAVSQASINQSTLNNQPFKVPKLEEQEKIGQLFQSLDKTITLHEEKYRQLERLKKALLQKMFADETGYPALRFKGFTEKWEHHKFKDVLKTHSFRQYLAEPQDNGNFEVIQQGDTPIIGYANGKPFTNYKEITLFGDHTLSLYKPIGPFFVATDGVKILSADGFDGQYLFATLERYKPKPQGYKRHFTILKNQNMWFTRGNYEQKKIGEFFTNFDTLITLHQHKIDNLKCLKRALLQKMFV